MFSFLPPLTIFNINSVSDKVITTHKLFHSTVNSPSYRSRGEERKNEVNCIFHYIIKGSGQVIYKGKSYRTKAGEGFFNIISESGSGYGYPVGGKEPWEFVVVSFRGGNIREIVKELLDSRVIYTIPEKSFCLLCSRLLKESGTEIKLSFFARLLSMIYETRNETSPISIRFKEIVERDILKNPTISAIADELKISREHLQRKFFKENNITPAKYLAHKRFEKLCLYLDTDMKEEEIYETMNFPSLSGMILFFKKMSGITPKQYRKNGYITI